MALKKILFLILAAIALISGAMFAGEIYHHREVGQYNAAIRDLDYPIAAPYLEDKGIFAQAFGEQQSGEYQVARVLYSRVAGGNDQDLQAAAWYNLGNSYLKQVSTINMESDSDLALPLIELAKSSYRKALKVDSEIWRARHNLEKALFLLPDTQPPVPMESEGRRGAVRTVISADSEENLP